MMQLSVKTLDSLTHNFTDLDEEITVVQFKTHISPTVTLAPEQQRLIFRGRVLQDDKKLRDYNVTSGQVIHLVARNPTESTPANDHPQPQLNTQNAGGGGGRNNAIIMGTIGTLEFSNSGTGSTNTRRRNSAAVRLTVANQCLTRASNLLRTLEDEVALLEPQRADESSEEEDEAAVLESIALQHAATTATVMASVQQSTQAQPQSENATGPSSEGASDVTPDVAVAEGTPSTESGYVTPNTGTSTPRPESPMLRELATSLNDVIALNSRLTPYLQTVQRWLAENSDLGQNQAAVQYTYNTISSILHSVSHSIHALSDLTIDFSLPPAQRRLRAQSTVWVEQSPVMRATIPIGVHVGVETTNNATGTGNGGELPNPPAGMQQQIIAQGILPGGGGMQIQQVISNLIQGVMSGQIQPQQQQAMGGITPNQAPRPPPPPPNLNVNNNNTQFRPGGFPVPPRNQFTRVIGPGFQLPMNMNFAVAPPQAPPSVQPAQTQNSTQATPDNATAAQAPIGTGAPGNMRTTMFSQPQPATLPTMTQRGHLHSFLESLPQPQTPRLENMVLQCRSHHYTTNSSAPAPQRPENLTGFLSQETGIRLAEDTLIFDTVASLIQGFNLVYPILAQYVRASVLRGRDSNNAGHVTTGVRVYARRLVDWIVGSISSSRPELSTAALTTRLVEVVTQLMSSATQFILNTPAGSAITPKLGSLLNKWMPKVLEVLEEFFPAPEHLRIFKGIIHLIVSTCFPGTSVMFNARLTAGIAEYLMSCQPSPPEPEMMMMNNIEAEVSMEIDVEFENPSGVVEAQMGNSSTSTSMEPTAPLNDIVNNDNVPSTSGGSTSTSSSSAVSVKSVSSSANSNPSTSSISNTVKNEDIRRGKEVLGSNNVMPLDDDDDENEEDLRSELQSMTDTLFRGCPPEWHDTLLNDIRRQEGMRQNSNPEPSPGFLSLFPRK